MITSVLGALIGGIGRLSVPVFDLFVEYIKLKKFPELSRKIEERGESEEETKEPKRFTFMVAVFFMSIAGLATSIFIQIYFNFEGLFETLKQLEEFCYFACNLSITWVLTGKAVSSGVRKK